MLAKLAEVAALVGVVLLPGAVALVLALVLARPSVRCPRPGARHRAGTR